MRMPSVVRNSCLIWCRGRGRGPSRTVLASGHIESACSALIIAPSNRLRWLAEVEAVRAGQVRQPEQDPEHGRAISLRWSAAASLMGWLLTATVATSPVLGGHAR